MTTPELAHGMTTYSFTKDQLDYLAACLKSNHGSLSSALFVFVDSTPNISMRELLNVWLPFAEKIKADPDFPEKQFSPQNTGHAINTIEYAPTPKSSLDDPPKDGVIP